MIPYGRQDISAADINAVVEVLESDFLTQGPAVPAFEEAIAAYCGASYGIAVNSATSALHIACLALGVGAGDLVWTSPVSFVASSNCALYCGADVDFVDIDLETGNLSIDALRSKLEAARESKRLPKLVIPVHLAGTSCNMREIAQLSNEYGFRVVEDASHAIGGRYEDLPVGSCAYSDITVFSFHPVKIITTGEGGLAVTNNQSLAQRMRLLRSHGVTRDADEMTRIADGPWYYEQIDLGFNYRMTDLQAALGLSQAKRLDSFVSKRNEIAGWYDQAFAELPVTPLARPADVYSALHLYVIRVMGGLASHRNVFEQLRSSGIGVNLHYMPIYLQPYYRNLGFTKGQCPNAEDYYTQAITLPLHPGLTETDLEKVAGEVASATNC
jgi:UDP-4-amino-4,6-dideoxy-N-acetyl-beta-L-altrosamine transaminase